jgi:hypothetical protein
VGGGNHQAIEIFNCKEHPRFTSGLFFPKSIPPEKQTRQVEVKKCLVI